MYRELGFRHPINLDPLNLKGFVSGQPPYSDLDEDESPTFAMKFCPVPGYEDHLCLGNEEGVLKIYDTKDHLVKYVTPLLTLRLHSNALMDLAYAPRNHRQLVSVSGDSTAVLWDLENKEKVKTFKGHKKSVKVAEWSRSDDNVFVTGKQAFSSVSESKLITVFLSLLSFLASRDNSIQMWDLRCHNGSKPENAIRNAHSVYSKNSRKKDKNPVRSDCSVTSVKFLEDNVIVSCGDHDGYVKVWDWRRNYSLYKGDPVPKTIFSLPKDDPSFAKGFTSMAVDYVGESSKSLFVNCMNDRIYKFDLVSCDTEPCTALKTISNSSFYTKIALSPDGTYLVRTILRINFYLICV